MWMCPYSSIAMLGNLPTSFCASRVSTIHEVPSNLAYSRSFWERSWYAMCGMSDRSTSMETEVAM